MNEVKDKQLVTGIPEDIFKKLKHLSVDMDKTIKDLVIESIKDLMVKYERRDG